MGNFFCKRKEVPAHAPAHAPFTFVSAPTPPGKCSWRQVNNNTQLEVTISVKPDKSTSLRSTILLTLSDANQLQDFQKQLNQVPAMYQNYAELRGLVALLTFQAHFPIPPADGVVFPTIRH